MSSADVSGEEQEGGRRKEETGFINTNA